MSIQTACPERSVLNQALLGQLPEDEAEAVERHLLTCEQCLQNTTAMPVSDTLVAALSELPLAEREQSGLAGAVAQLKARLHKHSADLASSSIEPTEMFASGDSLKLDQSLLVAGSALDLASLLRPAQGPDELGRLGPFRALKLLGMGGMGAVFEAEDVQLKRRVALKVMRPGAGEQSMSAERFLREAQMAASLHHDHIVTIFQVGQDGATPYMAMELLAGESLDDRLQREEVLTTADTIRIGREMAEGLAVAHAQGVLHRDVKPANIWLEMAHGRERVKVLDFGLARPAAGDVQLTQSGTLVGTPAYMAPEQAAGLELDPRSDLFSLGCVLYRACTGQMAFRGSHAIAILSALANHSPTEPTALNPAVPRELSALIMQLLAKKPADRPASAAAVVESLERISRQPDLVAPKPTPKPAGVGGISGKKRLVWIAAAAAALIVLCGVIVTVYDKSGNKLAQFFARDGVTVTVEPDDKDKKPPAKEPPAKVPPTPKPAARIPAGEPLGDAALIVNPAKIEGVQSWSIEPAGHIAPVTALAYSATGNWLATGDERGIICLWETRNYKLRRVLIGGREAVNELAWSPDEERLAATHPDVSGQALPEYSLFVWHVASGRQLAKLHQGLDDQAHHVTWSPDGKSLLVAASKNTAIWDTATYEEPDRAMLSGTMKFSPKGDRLAGMDGKGVVHFYDSRNLAGLLAAELPEKMEGYAQRTFAWSPTGDTVAVMAAKDESEKTTIWFVEAATGKVRAAGAAPPLVMWLGSMSWRPDGGQLAVLTNFETIELLDAVTGKGAATLAIPHPHRLATQQTNTLAWSPDGQAIALACSEPSTVHLFDVKTGMVRKQLSGAPAWGFMRAVTWLAPGNQIIADYDASRWGGVATWDASTGRRRESHADQNLVAFARTRDGTRRVTLSGHCARQTNPANPGEDEFATEGPRRCFAFSDDGQTLATEMIGSHKVNLYNVAERRLVKTHDLDKLEPEGTGYTIASVALSKDGGLLALGAWHFLELRNANTGALLKRVNLSGLQVLSAAFSPDGKLLAAGFHTGQVQVWDAGLEQPVIKFRAHAQATDALGWSPDGKILLTGSPFGVVRAWEPRAGRCLATLLSVDETTAVAISPEGHCRGTPLRLDDKFVYVVQTDAGQQTLTPAEFAEKFGWKNDPERVTLTSE